MHSFIFIGRSGCGKGTQAELLKKYLLTKGSEVLYIETGEEFRNFIKGGSFSSQLSNEAYASDVRQPDFLAAYMWTKIAVEKITGKENLIFDGTPRSLPEAKILETALKFYRFEKPIVIYLNVSREWSKARLLSRGRFDDATASKIDKRLDWFDNDVLPAVWYFRDSPIFSFIDINGEQTVEAVHSDIISNLPTSLA